MLCGIVEKIVHLCMVSYGYESNQKEDEKPMDERDDITKNSCVLPETRECGIQTDDWAIRSCMETLDNLSSCSDLRYQLYQFGKTCPRVNSSKPWFSSPMQTFVLFVMDTNSTSSILQNQQKMLGAAQSQGMISTIETAISPLVDETLLSPEFVLERPISHPIEPKEINFHFVKTNVADEYEKHFFQKDHTNLVCIDELVGPVVLSLKNEDDGLKKYSMRCILRLSSGSKYTVMDYSSIAHKETLHIYRRVIRQLDARLYRNVLQPVSLMNCLNASSHILEFDKKMEINTFKFGVLYQKSGQTTEEAILGNKGHSEGFETFLDLIAQRVRLKNFDKYLGGLDNCGDVENESYYTTYRGKEIMFHISTMIPHRPGDRQQLERKRHIGNDIVTIVFQDCSDTSFSPEMFQSKFSHCIIVVRPVQTTDGTAYQMNILRRKDVPQFSPLIPSRSIRQGQGLRTFLLTKLIQAEYACYRAKQFRGLQTTARRCLLESLVAKLRPDLYLNSEGSSSSMSLGSLNSASHSRNSVIYTVKKALLSKRMKQKIFEQSLAERAKSLPSESEPKLPELKCEYLDEDDYEEDFRRMRIKSDSHPSQKIIFRPYSSYTGWLSQDSLEGDEGESKSFTSLDQPTLMEKDEEISEENTDSSEVQPMPIEKIAKDSADQDSKLIDNSECAYDQQMTRRFKSLTSIQNASEFDPFSFTKERKYSLGNLQTTASSEL